MPHFQYKAIDFKGQTIEKRIEAIDDTDARLQLENLDLTVLEIKSVSNYKLLLSKKRVKKKELALFCRQLSHLLKTGITLHKGVELIGDQVRNPYFKTIVDSVVQDIKSGMPMSQACAKYPKVFPESMSFQLEAAETGGFMHATLFDISQSIERDADFTKKVKGAMIYPLSVLGISIAIVYFMLATVVPSMAETLAGFDAELPAITLLVMKASEIAKGYWYIVLGGAGAVAYLLYYAMNDPEKRRVIDKFLLKIPVLGGLIVSVNMAKIGRVMSSLLSTGVPIDDTLENLKNIISNTIIKDELTEVKKDVIEQGVSLSVSMNDKKVFPKTMVQVISIGEESGSIAEVLTNFSDGLEEEASERLATITSLINPILMVLVGIIVGAVVLSLFLPMFALMDSF